MAAIDIEESIDEVRQFHNQMPWKDINQPGLIIIPPQRGFLIDPNIYLDISFEVLRIDASGKEHEIGKLLSIGYGKIDCMT